MALFLVPIGAVTAYISNTKNEKSYAIKKLFSPTLDKALTFLDDKLLPSTSHAVERGNRRYRKRQKQICRVRTQAQISARLALDMWRKAQGAWRHQTLHTFHEAHAA